MGDIDPTDLGRIADDLLRGVEDDERARKEWVEARKQGLRLLGLKIEIPGLVGDADGAPVEGMSTVRHPLLLEAVLRFQANARSELLPTDGPVKIRNDDANDQQEEDHLADALEQDLNHYLTAVATEYYPDTDRMLLMLGFGGTAFKKVYFCPLRNRPVSESVDAENLIVNNEATDLRNAKRITHKIQMTPATVKRMQILGVYRDIPLPTPLPPKTDDAKRERAAQQGVSTDVANPEDRDREIYECYCELDIPGFEHKKSGEVTGLPIPYRVTIDVSSREILSIVRNYDEGTQQLPKARQTFVKYTYVPGLGFYDIGLLHILGDTANALTAGWRELLDAGMYANFPGFLIAKQAARQNTSLIRVPPGGGQQIDLNGVDDIRKVVMSLPYNAQAMPPLMDLIEAIAQTGQRIGGVSEQQVGEGRADAPVGTTLALIEQATRIENAVHKRLHAAQSEEFQLLCECFRENPESFLETTGKSRTSGRSDRAWTAKTFQEALENYELVPQADPNTASHTQRLMKVMALVQAAQQNPTLFNVQQVQLVALQTMGWNNPQQFINATPQADPRAQEAAAKSQSEQARGQAAVTTANARMLEARAGLAAAQQPPQQPQPKQPDPLALANLQLKTRELDQQRADDLLEAENRERDRESDERQAAVQLMGALLKDPAGLQLLQEHGFLPPGFVDRLESNETPIPGLPKGDGGA